MVQATINERQFRGINRTVCIGLGGTGRDILMRIRRLIVERHGHLNNLPNVRFVHIDTDPSGAQATTLRTGNTYHGVDLSFDAAERIAATMSATEVTNFVRGMEQRSKYDRQGPYDHISIWFPPQLLRNIKAIEDGAKGIRPVGRLAFFHNYGKIRDAIASAESATRGHDAFLLQSGLVVAPGLNIFVVGSLCGGTGSGMFLDVAYSLRERFGNQGAQITGYLIISPELYGDTPNMIANTYASLKELNHYTMPGTRFTAAYDMRKAIYVTEDRPPFDYAYLVSNQTLNSYKILEQGKLCNVIAHKIALDFSSELAPSIRGRRDNFTQHLLQADDHPRPNPQNFLTFGLSFIYFPRDTTSQVALNQIGLKLVQFWLNGIGQSPDPVRLLENFLRSKNWHDDSEKRDGITTLLAETVQYEGRSFNNELGTWKNKINNTIEQCKTQEERARARQQINRAFQDQFRRLQPGETEATRGGWLTQIQRAKTVVSDRLKQDIDNFVYDLLRPDNTVFSVQTLRSWLEAMITELNRYQRALNEQLAEEFDGFSRQEDLDRKIKNSIEQSITTDRGLRWPFGNTSSQNRQAQDEMRHLVQVVERLMRKNFDLAVSQSTSQIIETLQQHVQQYIGLASNFNNLLEDLKLEYSKEEIKLQQLNFDEMSGEAIFDIGDVEAVNEALLPQDELRSRFAFVSTELLKSQGWTKSLESLLRQEYFPSEQLQEQINLVIDRQFGSKKQSVIQSVIRRFMQKYPTAIRAVRLTQILEQAEPLLPLDLKDPYFKNTLAKKSLVVGLKNADERDVTQFKELLLRNPGFSINDICSIQAEDEVAIVKEYAGFPLRLIQNLSSMQKTYLRERNMAGSFLHTDRHNDFVDMLPPDASLIEEVEDIFYPCIALKLITQNPENSAYEFEYHDDLRGTNFIAALSLEWNRALDTLTSRLDMREALAQLLSRAEQKLQTNLDLLESEYLPNLREFVAVVDDLDDTHPNYPFKAAVVGTRNTSDVFVKEAIMDRFHKRLERLVATARNSSTRILQGESQTRSPMPSVPQRTETSVGTIDEKRKKLVDLLIQDRLSKEEFDRRWKDLEQENHDQDNVIDAELDEYFEPS